MGTGCQSMAQPAFAAAARIIAEDGLDDYAAAKRRAARQLGAEATQALPNNEEVEDALRAHLALYEADEQEDDPPQPCVPSAIALVAHVSRPQAQPWRCHRN